MERPHLRYIEAGGIAPTPSIAAVTAPGKALGQFGEALAGLGEKGFQIAERIRTEEEGGKESKFFLEVEKDMAAFQNGLLERQDFDQWQGDLDTRIAAHRERINAMDLSPAARKRVTQRFDDYIGEKQIKIGGSVAAGKVSHARGWDAQALKSRQDAKDWAGLQQQIESMRDRYPGHEIARLHDEAKRLEAYDQAETTFRNDPMQVDGYLKDGPQGLQARFPGLDRASAEQLERVGQRFAIQAKNEFWEGLLNRAMDEGRNSAILSRQELQDLAEQGIITAQQRASYIAAYHAPAPPEFDPVSYNETYGRISTYDPASDPTGAGRAYLLGELATLPQPKAVIAELHERLNERSKPAKPKLHKLAGNYARNTETLFDNGRFGDWFSYGDHDGDPRTIDRKIISQKDFSRASVLKVNFTDAFDAWLRNQPDSLDPLKAQEVYDGLLERMVNDHASSAIPAGPALMDFGSEVDRVLGIPTTSSGAGGKTAAPSSNKPITFGGQAIKLAGAYYRNVRPTIFGGANDPDDEGFSAFGGRTGPGGREGVAIPGDILRATFPGKDKKWFDANVRAVVKTADGRQVILRVADLGTAERIWRDNQRPVLDLTEGAVRALGGRPVHDDQGKLKSISGLGDLSFALTTADIGPQVDLRGMPWTAAQDLWFQRMQPTRAEQITSGLSTLRTLWNEANADIDIDADDHGAARGGDRASAWGDGSGGDLLPE